ncbi:DUF5658 family protein [Haloarcula sp. GH36]|uniref:DUF5658 family protein n=1 Tax=Haloarcula montana TaxID=3111776 RepID=UPI002D7861E8|nr:DUF5658 family protein [Haloarcula sp. GH36]
MTGPPSDDSGSLFTLRRERRMTRTHTVLWGVILAATTADILLTMIGLASGFEEGNLVVATLLAEFGLAGLWLVKFGAMVWLVGGWALLSDRNAAVFLGLFALVTVTVVVHNAALLLGV